MKEKLLTLFRRYGRRKIRELMNILEYARLHEITDQELYLALNEFDNLMVRAYVDKENELDALNIPRLCSACGKPLTVISVNNSKCTKVGGDYTSALVCFNPTCTTQYGELLLYSISISDLVRYMERR